MTACCFVSRVVYAKLAQSDEPPLKNRPTFKQHDMIKQRFIFAASGQPACLWQTAYVKSAQHTRTYRFQFM
jgi:hypothetical protein